MSSNTRLRRFRKDQSGSIGILAAACVVVLIGMGGLGVDFGYVYYTQSKLQESTDAAALAGAQMINAGSGGTAISTATHYSSSGTGALNTNPQVTVSMASGYPALRCLSSTGVSCAGPDSANAIVVSQTAAVPTFFAGLFGLNSWNISATSMASARGGTYQPVDVEIILDTTASMNTVDPNCNISGGTRETCAVSGVQTLLLGLMPCKPTLTNCGPSTNSNIQNPLDRVGLMVFPGVTNSSQLQYETDCSTNPQPAISKYSASPVYSIVPLSSDYRTSASATSLYTSSNIVLAARGGGSGCQQGLSAVGGVGTFYADAITAAQNLLASSGRANAQKVIVLLSDGAANAAAGNMPSGAAVNECHEGIAAAQQAAAAGTWVYSISYGASTNTSDCSTDAPPITPCATMQAIASDSTKYFSDTSGGSAACTSSAHPLSQLSDIFQYISVDVSSPRLLPLNTT
jgi:Flp pilus assembly protein TadG